MRRFAAILMLPALWTGCAVGGDEGEAPKPAAPSPAPAPTPPPTPPGPPAELARLDFLLGTWDVKENHPANEMLPQGGSGAGTLIVQKRIANTALIMVYRTKGPMGVFDGHGVIRYDSAEKVFCFWWFDSMDPSHVFVTGGTLEGETLTLTGDIPPSSKGRVCFKKVEDGKVEFAIDVDSGEGWKRAMDAVYTRK